MRGGLGAQGAGHVGLACEEEERKRPIGLLLFGELASCVARGGPH